MPSFRPIAGCDRQENHSEFLPDPSEARMKKLLARAFALGVILAAGTQMSTACTNTGSFDRWLQAFRAEARSQGISARALSALDQVTLDQGIIARDRRQSVFSQSFLEFSDRMANRGRIERGRSLIKQRKQLFDKIEQEFGVPAPVIA